MSLLRLGGSWLKYQTEPVVVPLELLKKSHSCRNADAIELMDTYHIFFKIPNNRLPKHRSKVFSGWSPRCRENSQLLPYWWGRLADIHSLGTSIMWHPLATHILYISPGNKHGHFFFPEYRFQKNINQHTLNMYQPEYRFHWHSVVIVIIRHNWCCIES